MKEKELVGKSVVSLADGARVGAVKDLVFHGLTLGALVVRGERGEGLLPFDCAEAIGPDAITIESYTLVDWNKGPALGPESTDLNQLRKLKVVTADGRDIGQFHDLTMDSTGRVESISVKTEGVFGIGGHETIIPASGVRAIGPNLITVESSPTVEENLTTAK
jgi:sporulation protein YlmC with PRC-barrel domain